MTQHTFKPLALLYEKMDQTWNAIADDYGFQCNGCEDNCCRSLFFHHTYIEKAYFLYGLEQLDPDIKKKMTDKAVIYCEKTFPRDSDIRSLKLMCPANEDGRCLLYEYRPMICRLHGLPHELCRPGSKPIKSTGCDAGRFDDKLYIQFDRTPFYQQMAQIEMTFRQLSHHTGKLKETIAQMIVS